MQVFGYTPVPSYCYHMWIDKMVCLQPTEEWREDVVGKYVDDAYIKWVVTLLALD